MENLQIVLDQVMAGQMVGHSVWLKAREELERAKALDAAAGVQQIVAVGSPEVTVNDELVEHLGELFSLFEEWVMDQRRKGLFTHLRTDIATALINASKLLKRCNHEPIKIRNRGPLTDKKG